MTDIPAALGYPIAVALVSALGVVWKAWQTERAERAAERKADLEWKQNLLTDVLTKEDK